MNTTTAASSLVTHMTASIAARVALVQQQRQAVLEQAKTWLGTPYHHQGRIKGVGIDCATLLCEVYHAAGVAPFVDPTPYPQNWHVHRADERYMGWVNQFASRTFDMAQVGDLVLFKFGRAFSHGGIYAGNRQVIHSLHGSAVICTSLDDAPLLDRARITYTFWADS